MKKHTYVYILVKLFTNGVVTSATCVDQETRPGSSTSRPGASIIDLVDKDVTPFSRRRCPDFSSDDASRLLESHHKPPIITETVH